MTRYQAIFQKLAPRAGWACAGLVFLGMAVPRQAHAQFGIDLGIILAGLQKISSLLTSSVASPLSQIQKIEQQEQQYQQQVMYPLQAINSARSLATSFTVPMQSMKSLLKLNISSATLPTPQQLEQQMLSGNPNSIGGLGAMYSQVYGALPTQTAVPANIRTVIDMTDAQAQDAMKKAIELDALASRELEVAQTINEQLQTAAPGIAPILEAEGSTWVLQGNAYSQSALAELLRVRTAELSNAGGAMKNSTTQTQQFNGNILGIITH
jgi:hypothetical protein